MHWSCMLFKPKIYDPIIANVDTEVSDEEAKQTSISYITVSTAGTEKDDDGKTIDLTDEEKGGKERNRTEIPGSLKRV